MNKFKLLISAVVFLLAFTSCSGQKSADDGPEVTLETTVGVIRIRLFNDTPGHRDNFIQNVKDGVYDGVTFHRVIRNFMIQAGDPHTKPGAEPEDTTVLSPMIPAEFLWPTHFHKRAMVGAAREGEDVNPERQSDKYEFYIVTGKTCSEEDIRGYEKAREERDADRLYNKLCEEHKAELDAIRRSRDRNALSDALEKLQDEARYTVSENPPITYPDALRKAYKSSGGAPWLDGEYTVFGEVVEGMKVVDAIQRVKTGNMDRPLKDIRIIKATVVE